MRYSMTILLALLAGFTLSSVDLQAQTDFDTMDADGDSYLDSDEFAEWVDDEGLFTTWDIDADSELDADEINEGVFAVWDLDDDDIVTEDEWEIGVNYTYFDLDAGVFDDWDVDGDSELDLDEVSEGLDVTQWNEDWYTDVDPVVGYDEFVDSYYTLWDLDDDGRIDTVEYHGGTAYWVY